MSTTAVRTRSRGSSGSGRAGSTGAKTATTSRPAGRRTPLFVTILVVTVLLLLLSAVMSLSATPATSLSQTRSAWSWFTRHMVAMSVGFVVLVTAIRVDYHRWRPYAKPAMLLAAGAVAFTLLPDFLDVLPTINGAGRWISWGPLSVQPSEAAKPALVLITADLLSRDSRSINDLRATLVPVMAITATLVAMLMLQPHLGASLMMGAIAITMLWCAGTRLLPLLAVGGSGFGLAFAAVALSSWRFDRLLGFLSPWDEPVGKNYQTLRSLYAIASGGIDGVGVGMGRLKWGFLPHAQSDFIIAVVGEELGLVGSVTVLLLFTVFGFAGFVVAARAPDEFGRMLAVGITVWISLQAVVNIAMATSTLPVVGMTLPLLSYGGSSMVATMAGVGVLLNVARQVK